MELYEALQNGVDRQKLIDDFVAQLHERRPASNVRIRLRLRLRKRLGRKRSLPHRR